MKEKGKETAFLQLIDYNQGIIHKTCFLYCRNNADREDLYQEIILQLWKSFSSFKGQAAFSTWMYRVALNTAITMTKKKKVIADPDKITSLPHPMEDTYAYSDDIKVLYKAISRLNKVEKGIILLWLEEKSYEEIAETIGITVKNVSVKLVRIKSKLAEIINKIEPL